MALLSIVASAPGLNAPASTSTSLLSASAIPTIARGGVHVEPNWLPPTLMKAMRADAKQLFSDGLFSADGLTNTAVTKDRQGFSRRRDRQTFRGDGWASDVGDQKARLQFASRMANLREELALGLDRPTLAPEGVRKHEMTYNWYEPGAALGRHLDEHHEETKGTKGWQMPTRRSVTWLVYLNDGWKMEEGGSLRAFPRPTLAANTVGADDGNLQIGWIDGTRPVFMDAFREGDSTCALYTLDDGGLVETLSPRNFDVPRQPVDFSQFVPAKRRGAFEQISTSRLDPRFASAGASGTYGGATDASAGGDVTIIPEFEENHHVDILPAAGTLVLFDSVSMPHLVRAVTGDRQRIAATGWFHEDNQMQLKGWM